jgi:hypothetical protein
MFDNLSALSIISYRSIEEEENKLIPIRMRALFKF